MKPPANLMKLLRLLSPILVVALLVAGCGGGGSSAKVTADDIAVVDTQHITQTDFNTALAEQKAQLLDSGQTVPGAGTSQYTSMRDSIVSSLVQQAIFGLQAGKLGITVKPSEVDQKMVALKKQCCKGDEKKYEKTLKQQHYTDAELRHDIGERLLEQKLYNKVTKTAKATAAEIAAYYAQNISQYQTPETRKVEEILVGKNKEALANKIYSQVKGGANFGKLAKQYSQDPGSKNSGGLFTATKGSDVPEFDAAVFAPTAKTNALLKPVNTSQYGWFVIEPLADIVPAKTTPEKKAAATIRTQLDSTKQQAAAQTWLTNVEKGYCSGGKISYQTGYKPANDLCSALKSPNKTTT
jgi:parvulin-like peptidyl-prolyl isomerase